MSYVEYIRRKSMSRLLISILAAVLISFVGAAQAEDLPIGVVGSLSGGGTEWGIATQRGVELAVAEVQAAGGLKVGNKTYSPKVIMYDDQYTGQGGTTAATRLINIDGVKFILGPVGSPAVLGVLGVTQRSNVLVLSNGFSPKILTPESKFNFRVSLTTSEFSPAVIEWLRGKYPNVKRVGVLLPNDAVGQSVAPILLAAYKNNGFEILSDERYDRGAVDFTPIITRMMSAKVELIEVSGNAPGEVGLFIRQARQMGYQGTITGGPGYADEVIKVAASSANGFITYSLFDPTSAEAQGFVAAYQAKHKGPINDYAPVFYNASKLLFEAMRRAGTDDVAKVRDEILKLEGFETIFGRVRWGGQETYGIKHQLLTDLHMAEIVDGKLRSLGKITR